MNNEFVPYELALRMKGLGFDEPCLAWYDGRYTSSINENYCKNSEEWLNTIHCATPLYQQAFRWFRDKHNLFGKVYVVNFGADEYSFDVYDLYEEKTKYDNFIGTGTSYSGTFYTYEEAELACLEKLIKIIEK